MFRPVALAQSDAELLELRGHRRIDVGVGAFDFMAELAGQRRDAAHEGAGDSQDVELQAVTLQAAVHGEVKDLGGSDAIRAIVITGAGSAFSSGHDLKEMTAHRNDPDRGRAFFTKTMLRRHRGFTAWRSETRGHR